MPQDGSSTSKVADGKRCPERGCPSSLSEGAGRMGEAFQREGAPCSVASWSFWGGVSAFLVLQQQKPHFHSAWGSCAPCLARRGGMDVFPPAALPRQGRGWESPESSNLGFCRRLLHGFGPVKAQGGKNIASREVGEVWEQSAFKRKETFLELVRAQRCAENSQRHGSAANKRLPAFVPSHLPPP